MSFEDDDDEDDDLQLDEDDEVSPSFPTQNSAVQPLPTPLPAASGGAVRNWPDRSWGTQSQKSPMSNQLGPAQAQTLLQPNRAAKPVPQARPTSNSGEPSRRSEYKSQPGNRRSLVNNAGMHSASHPVASSSARSSSGRAKQPPVTVSRPATSIMHQTAGVDDPTPVESSHTRAPFARGGASNSRKRPRRRRIPGPAGEIDGSQALPAAEEGRSASLHRLHPKRSCMRREK